MRASIHRPLPARLVTYNIRYAASSKSRFPHERPWAVRCPKLATQLGFITAGHESSFICLQEALYQQLQDVHRELGHPWVYIGEGRDGGKGGEFSPVFYRADAWKCDKSETLWLSETPKVPSRGWDAALNRVVTVGQFTHKTSGTKVVVMSTHFDHMGVRAREESAKLILQFVRHYGRGDSEDDSGTEDTGPVAVLLGGDFNSSPNDGAYKTLTAHDSGMVDIQSQVPAGRRYGNDMTYTSFGDGEAPEARIDFLFLSQESKAEIKTFGVLSNRFDDGVYISDHRPVVADIYFKGGLGMPMPSQVKKSVQKEEAILGTEK
jgi:endonuclease/exonuclease/phosphatase family metal-dependent hydrolase